jgi:hypothetical protein
VGRIRNLIQLILTGELHNTPQLDENFSLPPMLKSSLLHGLSVWEAELKSLSQAAGEYPMDVG